MRRQRKVSSLWPRLEDRPRHSALESRDVRQCGQRPTVFFAWLGTRMAKDRLDALEGNLSYEEMPLRFG
jgi:hypothetical protein